jgi:GTP-binding protein
MSLKVAIIGRPNVGKSTLFNRLVGEKLALVHDKPGLTRDRKDGTVTYIDKKFTLIDTAGLELAENGTLEELMMRQTLQAIEIADIILLTIDGRAGVTRVDEHFARLVRKKSKPTIMVVNKSETLKNTPGIGESYKLGFGEPVGVSAEHNIGIGDLIETIFEKAEQLKIPVDKIVEEEEEQPDEIQIAIVGRPNVGKSTMFNRLLGEERSIASDFAGTTRDSIYIDWEYRGRKIKLVDTAGMRKRAKRVDFLEQLSVSDTDKAVQYAHVAVLMIDAVQGIDKMDLAIAGNILDEGRGLVLVLNKWDAVENKTKMLEDVKIMTEYSLAQARSCPILTVSALEGWKVTDIIDNAIKVYESWNSRISTSKLNDWLKDATSENIPPMIAGRRVKLKYITQIKSRPPTFKIFTSSVIVGFPESYLRYLRNHMIRYFDFIGAPLRISLKKTHNPFEGTDRPRDND